jgi:hypothetical protein
MPSGLQQPKYNQGEPPRKPDMGEAFFLGREFRAKTDDADPIYHGGRAWILVKRRG